MDKLDDILKKNYRRIKSELFPPKKECPKEDLLWEYVRGKLQIKKKENIDGHLLVCPECLESLKAIRMIEQAQKSTQKVPPHLHKKVKEIFQKELEMPGVRSKERKVIGKISLIWNQLLDKITQLTPELRPDLNDLVGADNLQFQPVRRTRQDIKKDLNAFPFKKNIRVNKETINLEIDQSGKVGYLTLKLSFQHQPEGIADEVRSSQAILYKSDKMYSSVYFDKKGDAVFTRIKEGEYYLELLMAEKSLGVVELSISKADKG